MRIHKLISAAGLPMAPRCYNSEKGYEWQREIMYKYGTILGRYILSYIDPSERIHIACNVMDVDTLSKGIFDEIECKNATWSLYWLSKPKLGGNLIKCTRHEYKGARDALIMVIPILNEAVPVAKILNDLSEYSQTERIYVVTPAVVGNAGNVLQKIVRESIKKRLDIITLCHDIKLNYKHVSEFESAVLNDKSEASQFFIDILRQTRRGPRY